MKWRQHRHYPLMLVSAASVLKNRPLPLFDPTRVDIDAVGTLTRRMAVPMMRPDLTVPNPLFMQEIVSAAHMELIMTDLATWKGTRYTKDEMVARLMWQQGICNAVAWHTDRGACVRTFRNPESGPRVIDLKLAPEYYDRVYDALMSASVKYAKEVADHKLRFGQYNWDVAGCLKDYVKDALHKIRAEVLKYEIDYIPQHYGHFCGPAFLGLSLGLPWTVARPSLDLRSCGRPSLGPAVGPHSHVRLSKCFNFLCCWITCIAKV